MKTTVACPRPNRARRDCAAARDDAASVVGSRPEIEAKSGHVRKPLERESVTRSSFASQEACGLNGCELASSDVAAGHRPALREGGGPRLCEAQRVATAAGAGDTTPLGLGIILGDDYPG